MRKLRSRLGGRSGSVDVRFNLRPVRVRATQHIRGILRSWCSRAKQGRRYDYIAKSLRKSRGWTGGFDLLRDMPRAI